MKANRVRRVGAPDVILFEEIARPVPGADEMRSPLTARVLLVGHHIVPHGGNRARASAPRKVRARLSSSASSILASLRASPQSPPPRSA